MWKANAPRKIRGIVLCTAAGTSAILLLPRELVEKGMFLFSLGDKIGVLNKIYFHRVYEQFSGLAQFLGVSKQALSIRMKQLGLLEHDYLNDPDSILEVEQYIKQNSGGCKKYLW